MQEQQQCLELMWRQQLPRRLQQHMSTTGRRCWVGAHLCLLMRALCSSCRTGSRSRAQQQQRQLVQRCHQKPLLLHQMLSMQQWQGQGQWRRPAEPRAANSGICRVANLRQDSQAAQLLQSPPLPPHNT
jgi:hypothetical protein